MGGRIIVSVIVPVYGTERFLRKCLVSLLNQTFDHDNYEIVVVDDCSPDKSSDIISEFKHLYPKKIKSLKMSENSGLGKVRDYGIKNAEGDFLMFVDSDDYVHPDFIKHAVEVVTEFKADLVQFKYMTFDDNHTISESEVKYVNDARLLSDQPEDVLKSIDDICCNKIFRRSIIEKNGLRFIRRIWEDTCFVTEYALLARRVVITSSLMYYYYQNTGSLLHNIDPSKLAQTIEVNDELARIYRRYNLPETFIELKNKNRIRNLLIRMSGYGEQESLTVFSVLNELDGEFSRLLIPFAKALRQSWMLFRIKSIHTIGIAYHVKRILRRFWYVKKNRIK